MSGSLMILVAGPYRSGTDGDPTRILANMEAMTATALHGLLTASGTSEQWVLTTMAGGLPGRSSERLPLTSSTDTPIPARQKAPVRRNEHRVLIDRTET
jgi:hypothetical protein